MVKVAKSPVSREVVAHFALDRETPGALKYNEVDIKGNVLKGDDGLIGGLYLRKKSVGGKPEKVTVTVKFTA